MSLIKKVLKTNADKSISKERLLRHILSLNLEHENKIPDHLLEFGRILVNSWTRKNNPREMSRILRTIQPLEGMYEKARAFEYLKECASVIAKAEKDCYPILDYKINCDWSVKGKE